MNAPGGALAALLSGAAPFVAALAAALFLPTALRGALAEAMAVYGLTLLAFLGGVRWGAELARAPHAPSIGRLLAAAGAATLAAALIALDPPLLGKGAAVLALGAAHLAWDVAAARAGLLPAWTLWPRVAVTAVSGVTLIVLVALATG